MTMQELAREVQETKLTIAKMGQTMDGQEKRLTKAEEMLEKQTELLLVVRDLANGVKNLGEKIDHVGSKVDNVCSRVDSIEQKPARRWETITTSLILLIIGAVVGWVLTSLGIK